MPDQTRPAHAAGGLHSRGVQIRILNLQSLDRGSLGDGAKARLEGGDDPAYLHVRAAARAVGVPVGTAKDWLLAFLYWRSKSLGLKKHDPGPQRDSGPPG